MISFFPEYFMWHYGRGYREAFRIWKTFVWFCLHFFHVKLHLVTLFSRFQRLGENYPSMGLDLEKIASALIVNTIMRIVGILLRLIVICIGLISLIIVLISGLIFFALWTIYPLLVAFLVALGAFAFVI